MPNALKHSPHLMVSAFDQRDLVPGLVALGHQPNLARRRGPPVERDAALEPSEVVRLGTALDFDVIGSRYGRGASHQEIRQVAVVGKEYQARGVIVEPAHGIDPLS